MQSAREGERAVAVWPEAGVILWGELERNPGRFALLSGSDADGVACDLADLRGTVPLHVGRCLAEIVIRPNESMVRTKLRGHPVLTGIQVLFDPVLALEPVRLLAGLAKDQPPVLAVWPVATSSNALAYPPGFHPSRDTAEDLQGCLMLTTHSTLFADEVPFTAERFR